MFIDKFWNRKIKGIFGLFTQLLPAFLLKISDKLSTLIQTNNLSYAGKNCTIQANSILRNPNNIQIHNNVHIGRNVEISTEISSAILVIKSNSQISKNCYIDYSGNLTIESDCTLSENVMIQTHDHGFNPHNKPIPLSLVIERNVWIGTRATILHNVNVIGENSIVSACAVVTKDVPKNVIVAGNPAKIIKVIDEK